MKKLICLTMAIFFLSAGSAFAASSVSAGVNPESSFYWFDLLSEKIQLVFTLDPRDKVKALSRIGLERLLEAQETDNDKTVGKLISDYQKSRRQSAELAGDSVDGLTLLAESDLDSSEQLSRIIEASSEIGSKKAANALTSAVSRLARLSAKLEKIAAQGSKNAKVKAAKAISKTADRLSHIEEKLAKTAEKAVDAKGKKTAEELSEHVKEVTGKHISVLKGVLENAPEQAKKGIQNAIDRSSKGSSLAPEAVIRRGPKNEIGAENKSKNSKNKGKHNQ